MSRPVRVTIAVGADLVDLRVGVERLELSAADARLLAAQLSDAANAADADAVALRGAAVLRWAPGGRS